MFSGEPLERYEIALPMFQSHLLGGQLPLKGDWNLEARWPKPLNFSPLAGTGTVPTFPPTRRKVARNRGTVNPLSRLSRPAFRRPCPASPAGHSLHRRRRSRPWL